MSNDNQNEVYIEVHDNKIFYIYNNLQLHLSLKNNDLQSINNLAAEFLLIKLLK